MLARLQDKRLATRQVKLGSQHSTARLTDNRVMDNPRLPARSLKLTARSLKATQHRAATRQGRGIKVLLGDTLRPAVMRRLVGTRLPEVMARPEVMAPPVAIRHPVVKAVLRDSAWSPARALTRPMVSIR